jgi:3-oxoacyl-[acyl-carrier-protein] synthase-3
MGSYLPDRVLTNDDLSKMVDTSDEWIFSRVGIKTRRIAAPDEQPSDMGAAAAKKALENAGIGPGDVDLILVVTMSPDYISPSTAALIQTKIGADKAAAMDLQAACTGFLYGLSTAKAFVESGMYRTVLLVATEKMSAFMDYKDRNTCVLFGDGAAAVVVKAEGRGLAIDSVCLGTDGQHADLVIIPGGGARHPASEESLKQGLHYFKMNGKEVFKHAVRRMTGAAKECMEKAGLQEQNISWIIPHQANIRIMEAMGKHFNLPEERVYKTIQKYGNTSASSIPIALHELVSQYALKEGDHLLLVAVGGGLTWGASLLTQVNE